jgi:xylulose-5-phosphate/fructose-6-phosphate phosphoketolase
VPTFAIVDQVRHTAHGEFLDPVTDGVVQPILHLNGYKIANPTVLARIGDDELTSLLEGYGHTVYWVSGDDPAEMHQSMAATLDTVIEEITVIQRRARMDGHVTRPPWPMIVLRSPKGWTGPKVVDGLLIEGTWRSHQLPLAEVRTNPEHLAQLESWLWSYRPDELFDERAYDPAPFFPRRSSGVFSADSSTTASMPTRSARPLSTTRPG